MYNLGLAAFTFKLPKGMDFEEGCLIEPLSVGLQVVTESLYSRRCRPCNRLWHDRGLVTALAAIAAGCQKVFVSDIFEEKLKLARTFGLTAVNTARQPLQETVLEATGGRGLTLSSRPPAARK